MNHKKIKFKNIKKKLKKKDLKELILIIRSENKSSILSKLNNKNLIIYINEVIEAKQLDLFIAYDKKIIGYAITSNKPIYLTANFKKYQYLFLINLILKLKILTILNLIFLKLNIDNLLISRQNRDIFENSLNLNLLAITKDYQSKGLGKKLMEHVIKNKKNKNNKYLSCETDTKRALMFYKKKLNFKYLGKKIRIPKLMNILIKKI